jgi:hypothetical protein
VNLDLKNADAFNKSVGTERLPPGPARLARLPAEGRQRRHPGHQSGNQPVHQRRSPDRWQINDKIAADAKTGRQSSGTENKIP